MTSEDPILIEIWKRKEVVCLKAGQSFRELAEFAREQSQKTYPTAKKVNLHDAPRKKPHQQKLDA